MAITTTKLPNTTIGITYSVITDSSSDWASVSNDVYFFDKATDLPYYKNSSGTVVKVFEESGGGTTNLSIGSKTSTTLDIVSSNGTDATVPSVTTSEAGLSSAADKTKLDGIEANADVTDTENVTSAGALMDSEVTNLAQVKAFDSSDYATSTQGTTADNALPKSGGTMTGAITTNSTFDGRDVATDGTKLDGIEAGATADQTDSEIETAYNNQVAVVTQSEAEAGTLTDVKRFTPQRVKQAIDALAGGGGNAVTISVQKDSSGTINKSQVVRLADYDIVADVTTVELADNSSGTTMPAIGIATSSIGIASTGTVVVFGKATGLDTSSLSLGDVYVGTSGNLTNTKPTGTSVVQRIGKVTRVSSTVGEIIVFGGGMDNVNSSTADYVRASIVFGGVSASYASADQVIPMTVQSENSNTGKFTITSNGVRVNQAGRYRINCASTINSTGTQRANPIMKITVNNTIAKDGNNQDYQTSEHYARNAGSAQVSTSSLDIVLDLAVNDVVRVILAEGGVSGNSNVNINSTGTFLELSEIIAGVANNDINAIHTNVSGEILAVTEKTSVANTDEVIIEESGGAKKSMKRRNFVAPITTSVASTATLTVDADSTDMAIITAQAATLTIAAPTGTPGEGWQLFFRIKDNGTTRTINLNAIFRDFTGDFPTSTTASKELYFACKYDAVATKWDILAWKILP
tara:strand:+ start:742 stop:2817 length:2076 start_codon:yes stop_codon:yes gene_type:complete